MSKASEYAAKMRDFDSRKRPEAPPPFCAPDQNGERRLYASAMTDGSLELRGYLEAAHVPAFIAWLRDTFGEVE